MKKTLLPLLFVSLWSYAHADDLAASATNEATTASYHSIDFIDRDLKLTLACSVGDAQPTLNVTMAEAFASNSADQSVLIISSAEQKWLKLRGLATQTQFTSEHKTNGNLWERLSQFRADKLHLEAISFTSSKYINSDLAVVGFNQAVSQLKQKCSEI
ncbi:hypothetical protein K0H61_02480 [Shewanella acanthi]|nr:hypothetical protein K0H61_02480 [Shewanella acanthi]